MKGVATSYLRCRALGAAGGWRVAAAVALVLVSAIPSWAGDDSLQAPAQTALNSRTPPPYHLGVGKLDGTVDPADLRVDESATGGVAQATGAPDGKGPPPHLVTRDKAYRRAS